MASASASSAVVALAQQSKEKPRLSALQTPVSASYPSEIRSPLPGYPAYIKQEENIKTPITPPNSYLDFLKTMSPALMSPAPTGIGSHFSFSGKMVERDFTDSDYKVPDFPTSQPTISRTSSTESAATVMTIATDDTDASDLSTDGGDHSFSSTDSNDLRRERSPETTSTKTKKVVKALDLSKSKAALSDTKPKPQSPRILIPPTPFAKPASARLARRGQVPGSPLSPMSARTPISARSHHEPRSASCLSATPWSASFSPTEEESSSKTSKVCVRQVVTRTVTYSQTPLDPAPKGKRRKLEE